MTIVRVGGTAKTITNNAAGFTDTYTPTAGNLVVVSCACGNGVNDPLPATVKDNLNNALTIVASTLSSDKQRTFIAYYIVPAGAITSFTAAGGNGSTFFTHNATEWSGVATVSPLDQSLPSTGADPLSTGNITNTDPNALVFAVGVSDDNAASSWGSAGASYIVEWSEGDTTVNTAGLAVYQIASGSTGPFSASFHYLAATTTDAALIVSFKSTGSAVSADLGRMSLKKPGLRLGTPLSRLRGRPVSDLPISSVLINQTISVYSWSGTTSNASGLINAIPGTYSWAGSTSTINDVINAIVAPYSWSGTTAVNSGLINGIVGTYSWSGTTSNLVENISQSIGAYSWSGTTATLSQLINAGIGAYSWGGTTSTLGGPINASVGAFTWTGTTSSIPTLINSDGGALAYNWAGTTSSLSQLINSSIGTYMWAGVTATIPGSSPASLPSVYPFIANVGTLMSR